MNKSKKKKGSAVLDAWMMLGSFSFSCSYSFSFFEACRGEKMNMNKSKKKKRGRRARCLDDARAVFLFVALSQVDDGADGRG